MTKDQIEAIIALHKGAVNNAKEAYKEAENNCRENTFMDSGEADSYIKYVEGIEDVMEILDIPFPDWDFDDEDNSPDLPDKVTLNADVVKDFDYDDGDVDDDSLQECIDNYLSDEYGYCINSYNYKCHYNEKDKLIGIDIYNIDWDTSE